MGASLLQGFLQLVAPARCAGCDLRLLDASTQAQPAFCDACEPLLELAPAWMQPPSRTGAGWLYQGPLADAIRRFKYGGAGSLARPLGALFSDAARPYCGQIDAVVPLALHPSKLRARGYNPAALLARPVAAGLGVPLRVRWLERVRATRSQAGLPRADRQANVRGAFTAAAAPASKLLLIDDVRTTGATLTEAAATLSAYGHDVFTLALAWSDGGPAPSPSPASADTPRAPSHEQEGQS